MQNGLLDVDTVVLLGHSAQALARARLVFSEVSTRLGRPMRFVEWCISSESDVSRATLVLQHGRLATAILVIEPEGISSPAFATVVRRYVHEAIITESFALFVVLDGVTKLQIDELVESDDRLMAEIINCIQIPSHSGALDVRESLVAHLLRAQAVQRFAKWRYRYDVAVRVTATCPRGCRTCP